jgi:hypothetical protein
MIGFFSMLHRILNPYFISQEMTFYVKLTHELFQK